jgi:hypothetical protein
VTGGGVRVQIYRRGNAYVARGRYERKAFGESLGRDTVAAERALWRLLATIDDGAFVRPSDRPKRQLCRGAPPKLDVRSLCDEYLTKVRQRTGERTTRNYRARLTPLVEYAEQAEVRRRWPLAGDIDRDFVIGFRSFLAQRMISPNGRVASTLRLMAAGQIFNDLDCARTLFNWAIKPAVNRLPSTLPNPFTGDLVGHKPERDPLRRTTFPLDRRVQLVAAMDAWQLLHLTWSLVLPLRPEDFSGLLIEDIDRDQYLFRFVPRFGGADCNKGRQAFSCPYPREMSGCSTCVSTSDPPGHCCGVVPSGRTTAPRSWFRLTRQT